MWTWISTFILIVGAELNAEMEHQTTRDTTTGHERKIGTRGAVMADTIGKTADEPDPGKGHAYSARADQPAEGPSLGDPPDDAREAHGPRSYG
jgi:hypothetical protein